MKRCVWRLAAGIALCAAGPLPAQSAMSPASSPAGPAPPANTDPAHEPTADDANAPGDTIVVTGRKTLRGGDPVVQQARGLSRVADNKLYREALARLELPLCPQVSGIDAEAARIIASRIRANAAMLGVKLAKADCAPNMIVTFAEGGQELLSRLAQKHARTFCLVPASERAEILADDAPVRVWTDIRVVGPNASVWRCRWNVPSRSGGPGQMFLPSHRAIALSLVVFDREAVIGMTLVQLADYATMRGLAHMRPASGEEPMETILALFADAARRPAGLTCFDIGYLRSLYFWRPDVPAISKFLGIRRRVALAEGDACAPPGGPIAHDRR